MGYATCRPPDGKALAAYAARASTEALDQEKVKKAVLHRYDVNEETHSMVRSGAEEARKVVWSLHGCVGRWIILTN